MYHAPYYVTRVEGPDGEVLLTHAQDPRRAASVQSARLAAEVLEQNVQSGTGTRARIPGQHAAGKTGTAQNASDGWFVGATPYLATATWIGATTDNSEVRIGGTGITGGSYPAEIWGRYMRAWHDGLEEREFPGAGAGRPQRRVPAHGLAGDSVARGRRPAHDRGWSTAGGDRSAPVDAASTMVR